MKPEPIQAKALQYEPEIAEFARILAGEGIRSYLEIGSKFGGSLQRVAAVMPPQESRLVSVDLPKGTKDWDSTRPSLESVIADLTKQGFDTRMFWGDSTNPQIIKQVETSGPFDCVFIDANHTMPFVTRDWENYGWMGRIVAFHDIAWKRDRLFDGYSPIDVPKFWDEIKTHFTHKEIKLDPTGQDNGIGILWRS